jgi:hypothetical protein
MRGPVVQLPWTARPVLFAAAQAARSVFVPRFGRQLRLEPIDGDDDAREATQCVQMPAAFRNAARFCTAQPPDSHTTCT